MKKRTIWIGFLAAVMMVSTVYATPVYTDIQGHKDSKYIMEYAEKGLVDGYPDGTFRPDNPITRAEAVALLSKFELYSIGTSDKNFADVQATDWYFKAVNSAVNAGVVKGYSGNIFKPQNQITRFEAISIVSNLVRSNEYNTIQLPYTDASTIPLWVNAAVRNLYASGVIGEYDNNNINGNEVVTRSELIRMLAKVMEKNQWNTADAAKTALDSATDPLPRATEIPHDLLGYLTIESIRMNSFPVKDGADLATIKTAIGHFAESSTWDGNVSFCAHNRDYKYDFRNLNQVNIGDIVIYKTRFGERTYQVTVKKEIEETDWSSITAKSDLNMVTMMTCIESQPTKRLLVQAVQK